MVQHVTTAILVATTAAVTSSPQRDVLAPPPLAPVAERYARASAFYDREYDMLANTDVHPMLSRDGRSVLYRLGPSGSSELMVYDVAQGRSHAVSVDRDCPLPHALTRGKAALHARVVPHQGRSAGPIYRARLLVAAGDAR